MLVNDKHIFYYRFDCGDSIKGLNKGEDHGNKKEWNTKTYFLSALIIYRTRFGSFSLWRISTRRCQKIEDTLSRNVCGVGLPKQIAASFRCLTAFSSSPSSISAWTCLLRRQNLVFDPGAGVGSSKTKNLTNIAKMMKTLNIASRNDEEDILSKFM